MKSYLSLIPISAKVHKHQNRMTLMCIIISVFLVTAVFSMADMSIRMETAHLMKRHGNWHIMLQNVSKNDAGQIGSRSDAAAAAWYAVINEDAEEAYYINGRRAVLCGASEMYITKIWNGLAEGVYPKNDGEIMLSTNAKQVPGIQIGSTVTVNTPAGNIDYTVSGFGGTDAAFNEQSDAVSVFMNMTAFQKLCDSNHISSAAPVYYVQFKGNTNVRKIIIKIKEQYGWTDENISENTGLLAMSGFSSNSTMQNYYAIAAVLFILNFVCRRTDDFRQH